MSILGRVVRGALAGAVGTFAMDLVWYRRYRAGGGDDMFGDWEFATDTRSFDDASAPGEAGQRAAEAVGVELPDEAAGATTNVVHWLTGIGYGVVHGLTQDRRGVLRGAATTATGAFAHSYASLGAVGIYDPIWEYDRDTLAKDYSAHLAYGLATSVAYRLLGGGSARRGDRRDGPIDREDARDDDAQVDAA